MDVLQGELHLHVERTRKEGSTVGWCSGDLESRGVNLDFALNTQGNHRSFMPESDLC